MKWLHFVKENIRPVLAVLAIATALLVSGYRLSTQDGVFGATILVTNSGDTLTTFRTNTNANFAALNAELTALITSGSFSTTSADYWKTQRDFFSTTSAQYFVHSSTTIPKTYTTNTFTGANTFSGTLTASTFTLGSLNGPIHANNGVVSATTSIGVLYGGTGLVTAPAYGEVLVGNSSGGYTLTATSSLGIVSGSGGSSFSTTSANYWASLGLGFSTTSTDYWKTQNNFFSTTSANYWSSLGLGFSTTSAQYFAHSSTTIPKTYTDNTFSGTQTFNNIALTGTCSGCSSGNWFTPTTNFGALANSTSTPVWFRGGLFASSTVAATSFDISDSNGYRQGGSIILQASSTRLSTAVGLSALNASYTGTRNVAVGQEALTGITTGLQNTAVGYQALIFGPSNSNNTAIGTYALGRVNFLGNSNTGLGVSAGSNLVAGSYNTFLGVSTAAQLNVGSNNIFIGQGANATTTTASNVLNIGNSIFGINLPDSSGGSSGFPTGNSNIGIGSTSPFALFSVHAPHSSIQRLLFAIGSSTASATTTLFSVSNTGTTTIANGVEITAGCFKINGACLSSSSGTVTNISTTYPITGGPITNTGTLALDFGTTTANTWAAHQIYSSLFTTYASTTHATSTGTFTLPTGTAPLVSQLGQCALDSSDNQIVCGDSGGVAFVAATKVQKIWSATIASTSPAFISAGLLPFPVQLDGYTITGIRCYVLGGTSKVIAIEDASANSSEDITCATTATSDDGSITNATYTAAELGNIDFGATSGTVDYVSISVFGTWTRE